MPGKTEKLVPGTSSQGPPDACHPATKRCRDFSPEPAVMFDRSDTEVGDRKNMLAVAPMLCQYLLLGRACFAARKGLAQIESRALTEAKDAANVVKSQHQALQLLGVYSEQVSGGPTDGGVHADGNGFGSCSLCEVTLQVIDAG